MSASPLEIGAYLTLGWSAVVASVSLEAVRRAGELATLADVLVQALAPVAPAEARHALDQALQWVQDTARRQVPSEFRDSFLHRNPANRELLALAARLG